MSQVVIKMENLSQIKKKMSLEIPWAEVKTELDAVYQEIGKKAKIKGFRPGKVPRKMLETYYKEQAESETVTNIINKYYWQTLEEKGIVPISRPEISQEGLKENTDYAFAATFETEPEFEPQHYKGIDLEKEKINVTDDDVSKRINEIKQMFATMEEVVDDRPVVNGDYAVIDFTGSLNGESHKELNAQDYFLEIGSGRFIPGFEEQLIGVKKGETKEINVTFPADYHESRFAGQEVVFTVSVKSLREKKLPADDESFVKNFEKYSSFEDFKADVRKSLEEKADQTAKINLQNHITEALIQANEFEAPPALVERQIFYMMADIQRKMVSAGIDENNAIDFTMKMQEKYRHDAEKTVKSFLLLKKIAQKESFAVEDDELEKHMQEMALQSGRDYDSFKKMYEGEDRKDSLKMDLIQKKVFDFIESNANIKIVEKNGLNLEARQ